MHFPSSRLRRLRQTAALRSLLAETSLRVENFIAPLFIVPGKGIEKEISSLPGQYQLSIDKAISKAKHFEQLGIKSLLLFGIPEYKDETGSAALKADGIIQRAVRELKKDCPEMCLISDLCFCEYTSHGHCGIIKDRQLENDTSLDLLVRQAETHADAGIDMIAPSGMLDGCVAALRRGLDEKGYMNLPIMSYSAKFASGFYGPFREAVDSTPQFGDRQAYQMAYTNVNEALREVALDIEEGADIVMVKPALAYLDVIRAIKDKFAHPTAAYNVSGEYSMIKLAAKQGLIDGEKLMLEVLTSIKRAGADIIISYFAEEFASLRKT